MKTRNISKVIFCIMLSAVSFSLIRNVAAEETAVRDSDIIHVIKKGDTLWDISAEYLKNPFLWSSVWEKNSYIKNPDLIYPGDKVVIPVAKSTGEVTGEQAEGNAVAPAVTVEPVEAASPISIAPAPPESATEGVEIPESIRSGFAYHSSSMPPVSAEKGNGSAPQSPAPIIKEEMVFMGGYIADKVKSSGVITKSSDDRNVSAAGDTVNILFNNKEEKAAIGDRFTIFRNPKPVIHPGTGKETGRLFVPVGILEIYRVQGLDAGGRIVKSYDYISAGDQIQPFQPAEPVKEISHAASGITRNITGYIIGSREETIMTAEQSIVYLDRGSNDGLIPGVVLNVIGENTNSVIGGLMVISVQGTTSTALVTNSAESFGVGSRVESLGIK